MNKEFISTKQGYYLVSIFVIGTSLILGGGTTAKQDTWISALISLVMVFPMLIVYAKIITKYPNKHLFEILHLVFGKILGKFASVLYIWYFLHLATICIRNITEFIQVVSLPETPQYILGIFLVLLVIYMIKSGIEVLGRWGRFVLPFVLTLIITIGLLSFPDFKYENIKPILYHGWSPVLSSAHSLFSFPFAETVVFLSIFHTIVEKKKVYRIFITGVFIGGITITFTILKNMFALGYPIAAINYFPSYFTNMIINFGFLQRIEAVTSTVLILCGFAKACICLLASCIGLSHLLNISEYKDIAVPMGIIMLVLSRILYSNTMEIVEFIETYKYYALPFQVFFPILILIVGMIRRKKIVNSE